MCFVLSLSRPTGACVRRVLISNTASLVKAVLNLRWALKLLERMLVGFRQPTMFGMRTDEIFVMHARSRGSGCLFWSVTQSAVVITSNY